MVYAPGPGYIDFLILLMPTQFVLALFCSSIPTSLLIKKNNAFSKEHSIARLFKNRDHADMTILFLCYVDLKKAFYSIQHNLLWKKLHALEVSGQIIRVLQLLNVC